MYRTIRLAAAIILLSPLLAGCAHDRFFWVPSHRPPSAALVALDNPLFVPVVNREVLWQQVVDTVDDYFTIEREQRVMLVGGVLTEGRIDTVPLVGATALEPWRGDSTPGYERLHSTLQSVRRRAVVRVVPTDGGYLLDVAVYKELEDVDRPQLASAGGATLRHDNSLVRREQGEDLGPVTLGWIALGRDGSLEQEMLAKLYGKLVGPEPLGPAPPGH